MLIRRCSLRATWPAAALHASRATIAQPLVVVPLQHARSVASVDGSRLRLEAALRDAIADGDPEAASAAATALAMRNQRTKLADKATPADRDASLAQKPEDAFRIDVDVRVVDTSFVDVFADNEGVEESALEEASQQLLAVFMHYFSHEIDAAREAVRFHVREALQAELDAAAEQGEEGRGATPSSNGEDSSALLTALRRRVSAEAGIAVRVMPLLASSELTSIDAMDIVRSAATNAAVDEALAGPGPKTRRMRTAPMSRAAREARPRLLEALRAKLLVGALTVEAEAELADIVLSYVAARKAEGVDVPIEEARGLLLRDATAQARKVALAGQKRPSGQVALAGGGDDEPSEVPAPVTYDVGFHDEVRDQLSGILGALAGRAEAVDTVGDTVSRRVLRQLNDSARRGAQHDVLGSVSASDEAVDLTVDGELTPLAQAARDEREAARARAEVAKERDQALALPLPPFGSIMRLRVAFVPRPLK